MGPLGAVVVVTGLVILLALVWQAKRKMRRIEREFELQQHLAAGASEWTPTTVPSDDEWPNFPSYSPPPTPGVVQPDHEDY
jgi:hypothetical protein